MGRRRVVEQGMKVRNYSLKNWRVVGEYEADSGHTHTHATKEGNCIGEGRVCGRMNRMNMELLYLFCFYLYEKLLYYNNIQAATISYIIGGIITENVNVWRRGRRCRCLGRGYGGRWGVNYPSYYKPI